MADVELKVPTVHCRSCKLTIEESLEELPGVRASEVDLDRLAVTVTYDPEATDPDAITGVIEAAGYPVDTA